MSIFSSSKKESKLILAFDLGANRAGATLFFAHESNPPTILEHIHKEIPFDNKLENEIEPERLVVYALKTLDEVAREIFSKCPTAPTKIFFSLNSPWCISETRTIKLESMKPFSVSAKLADDLIKQEGELAKEEYQAKFANEKFHPRIIEFKSMKTLLNGYNTVSPIGKKAKELSVSIYSTISSEEFLEKIEEIVLKYFHQKKVKFFSFTTAFFSTSRDILAKDENFLLIGIDGETTEVNLIKNGIIQESFSFPLGKNFAIRQISNFLNIPIKESQTLISLHKRGHIARKTSDKIDIILKKINDKWQNNLDKALIHFSKNFALPNEILIHIPHEISSILPKFIDPKFKTTLTDIKMVHDYVFFDKSQGKDIDRDVVSVINTVYINRFLC